MKGRRKDLQYSLYNAVLEIETTSYNDYIKNTYLHMFLSTNNQHGLKATTLPPHPPPPLTRPLPCRKATWSFNTGTVS